MGSLSGKTKAGKSDALKQAQQRYHDLVTTDTTNMTPEQLDEHLEKCRQALIEKRKAAGII